MEQPFETKDWDQAAYMLYRGLTLTEHVTRYNDRSKRATTYFIYADESAHQIASEYFLSEVKQVADIKQNIIKPLTK